MICSRMLATGLLGNRGVGEYQATRFLTFLAKPEVSLFGLTVLRNAKRLAENAAQFYKTRKPSGLPLHLI